MAIIAQDQQTVLDVTDGYSVLLTNEAHSFPGSVSAALAGSATTQIVVMKGSEQVDASVVLSEVTKPAGVTVTKDSDATAPTLTIAVSTSVTADGEVVIPIHVGDLTFTKKFTFSISFKGATGNPGQGATNVIVGLDAIALATNASGSTTASQTVTVPFGGYIGTARAAATAASIPPSGVTLTANAAATSSADGSLTFTVASGTSLASGVSVPVTYTCNSATFTKVLTITAAKQGAGGGTGTAAVNAVVGNQAVTIPCAADGKTSAASTITIPFAGYQGTSRVAATIAASGLPSGMTAGTNTAATTSADGSLSVSVASGSTLGGAASGNFTLTVTALGQTFTILFTWSKAMTGGKGDKGNDGDDAITLKMESSNGLIFKNDAIATVLTAHVYQGGVELTPAQIATLGTVKWFKDGTVMAETGSTLTVDAGDVDKIATYKAGLDDGN